MRIKGVKRITVRKGGKVYVYYRHRASGKTISAAPGSAGFAAEVERLDYRAKAREAAPGSLGELIARYKAAPEHTNLALRTRRDYEKVLEFIAPSTDIPLISIDGAFMYGLRDKAFTKHKRRFSTYVVQVVRIVLEWGKVRGYLETNPAKGVKALRKPKNAPRANRAWSDQEREVVLREASAALRTVIALGMFAGLREGDAIRLSWNAYEKSIIAPIAGKTGEPLWIPAHFRLRQILEETPKKSTIIAVNSRGLPWTGSGFRASFFKFLKRLEKVEKIGKGLTYHGLRHTVGKLIIDAGGDTRDVGAILGHASEVSSAHYSREADQKRRATVTIRRMERIERKKMDKQSDNSSAVSTVKKC